MLWFLKRLIIIVYRHAFPTRFLVLPSKLQGLSPSHASLPSLPSAALLARDFFRGLEGIFCSFGVFWGCVFPGGTAGEPGKGWGKAAQHGRPLRTRGKATAGRGSFSPCCLCKARLQKNLIFKIIFLLSVMSMIKVAGGVRPSPASRGSRSAAPGCAGMRGEHRGAALTAIAPGSNPLHYYVVMILIMYDFYHYSRHWPRLTRLARASILSAAHRDGQSFFRGWDVPCQGPDSLRSPPLSPQPPPARSSLLLPRGAGNNFQPLQPPMIGFQQQLRIFPKNPKKYQKIRQRCYLLPCN